MIVDIHDRNNKSAIFQSETGRRTPRFFQNASQTARFGYGSIDCLSVTRDGKVKTMRAGFERPKISSSVSRVMVDCYGRDQKGCAKGIVINVRA